MIKWFQKYKLFARIVVVYSIHIIFKGFDYTFGNFLDFTARGIIFSMFFISVWVSAWFVAEKINYKVAEFKLTYRLLINIAFGYFVALLTNAGYRYGDINLYNNYSNWENVKLLNPELTISLLMFYLLIYTVFEYVKSQQEVNEKQLKTIKLEKENTIAQYKSLKAQIEPHFLFNSLSVLASIVHTDANLASNFIIKLSKTLRYIIEKNEFTLVPLKEELAVVEDYFYLVKTRFGKGIELVTDIDEKKVMESYIPPASIQLLIENAIKHNKQSDENPLRIEIMCDSEYIIIQNNLNKITTNKESTHVGLKNIKQRYKLLSDKDVLIHESSEYFIVKLPVLNQSHYENFNH